MQIESRQKRILDILMRRGYAGIDELVTSCDVTPQTIRRDLQELADQGLLRRHHGGASVMSSTSNTDYVHRHVESADAKARIAVAAVGLIAPGSSIFMTPGTTVEAAATVLAELNLADLRVITNSTVAAQILGRNRDIAIQMTGGAWKANNLAMTGPAAAEIAGRYRCDVMLTSVGGIDADGWLLEFREEEVVVAQAMLANARRRILLADQSKFSRVAACKMARIEEMTTLVTDAAPEPAFAQRLKDGGCELVLAE